MKYIKSLAISKGLYKHAQTYTSCWFNGYHYRSMRVDSYRKGTTYFGISSWFWQDSILGPNDMNLERSKMEYYGNVEKIIELDYGRNCKRILFKGLWYMTSTGVRRRSTQVMDECGFIRIKGGNHESNTMIDYEPFIVTPVFYVDDIGHKGHFLYQQSIIFVF